MPMPEYDPENPPMLGFFMVGAYQEILGNMHNLFGDTEAVDVFVFPDGSVEVELSDEGDTVADMLQEQREVDVDFIRHSLLQLIDDGTMGAVARVELLLHLMAHVQIQLFRPRALLQVEGA